MSNTTIQETQTSITVFVETPTDSTIGEISVDLFGELEIGINTTLIAKVFLIKYRKARESMDQKTALEFVNKQFEEFAQNLLTH